MPTDEPLLLGAEAAAKLCAVSRASWWRLASAGKTPPPIRLHGRTVWSVAALKAWIAAGCPALKARKAARS